MTVKKGRKLAETKCADDRLGENPWIKEMSMQDLGPTRLLSQRASIGAEPSPRPADAPAGKESQIIANEFNLELFRIPDKRESRQITRYDTWEGDLAPEEWLAKCKAVGTGSHGLSPVYNGETYIWQPVHVESYDPVSNKYQVIVMSSGQTKLVTRLALLFSMEDRSRFHARLRECRERRELVEGELRFQEFVDAIPVSSVTTISEQMLRETEKKVQIREDHFEPKHARFTIDRLLQVVEAIYRLTMKKCLVLKDMTQIPMVRRMEELNLPVKFTRRTVPHSGVVDVGRGPRRCSTLRDTESYCTAQSPTASQQDLLRVKSMPRMEELRGKQQERFNPKSTAARYKRKERRRLTHEAERLLAWQTGKSPVGALTDEFQHLCEQFKAKKLFQTDTQRLPLPMRSSDFMLAQEKKIKATTTDILNNWRFQILHEIRQKVKGTNITFDISKMEDYEKSTAKTLIRKYDYMFHNHLGQFFMKSLNEIVGFVQTFTVPRDNELWRVSGQPLIEVDIRYTGCEKKLESKEPKKDKKKKKRGHDDKLKKVRDETPRNVYFKPTLEECREKIVSLLDKLVEVAGKVTILETEDYNVFLSGNKQPAYDINAETPDIKSARSRLNAMIDQCVIGPQDLMGRFKKYEFLMNDRVESIAKIMEKEKRPTLEELRKRLDEYSRAAYEVQTLAIDKVQFTMFQVDTSYVKRYLAYRANKLKEALLKAINKHCRETIEDINKGYGELLTSMEDKPTSKDAYKVLKTCLHESEKRMEELKARHEMVRQHIGVLEDHLVKIEKDVYSQFFKIYLYPGQLRTKRAKGNNNLISYEEQIRSELEKQKDQFDRELNKYKSDYADVIQFSDIDSAKYKYRAAFELQKSIASAVAKSKELNEDEDLLEMKRTEYSMLDKLDKDFEPFYALISNADEIQKLIYGWTNDAFIGLKPAEVEDKIRSWQSVLDALNKTLEESKEQADVALQLKGVVTDFTQHLELIKCLRSEAMKEEEWNEISRVTSLGLKHNDETLTLHALIKKGAERHMEEIREIWDRAERKLELEKGLKKMKEEMNRKKLDVVKYSEANAYIIQGYGAMLETIDEQISATQTMLSSPYMTGMLRRNCSAWAARLTSLSEILEELKECQQTWIYLQPMFASEDIRLTLKREAEQFAEVDNKWRQQTETMNSESLVVSLLEKERIKEEFTHTNETLESILQSMCDFLESKRKKFPRFYFLSDDDLLRIISHAKKDPATLQPYFNKCFEGISGFEITSPNQEIVAISSPENERLSLIRPLGLKEGDRKGNAEIWLKDLEKIMNDTLRDSCKRAFKDYPVTPRDKWATSWPGQIVLLVNQIMWTAAVEASLRDSKIRSMEVYDEKLKTQIAETVALVRGELSYVNRLTVETLLVLDVHEREIVRNMIEKKVLDETAFDWVSQLRYNYEKDDVRVRMVTANLRYGFEYMGNTSRLVVTPLTDRCYRTLMVAKQLNRGGALEGPAGTGKTETVKDLAKALGVFCVIFNGAEELDHLAAAKFFKGIASAGAWCCFDEFNRIDLEVLSVIASQILMIQQALTIEQSVFHFIDEEVELNPQCGINITMNPAGVGRTPLPDNLKSLFRPCAMIVPDFALISETLLYSFGFHEAKNLARKVVTLLRLCTEQLSSQPHYDFGMRALHAILCTIKSMCRSLPSDKEELLVRHALDEANLPKLTAQDIPLYEGIAADLFPGTERRAETNVPEILKALEETMQADRLETKEEYLRKCVQIYETTKARHGVIVIGEPSSGKTQALRSIRRALSSLKEYEGRKYGNMLVRALNPKAIEFEQLYGSFDGTSRVWIDGVLALLIKECNETPTEDMKWLVFDGPVDTAWMESMNTVLDDSKKLCLCSGSVLTLKPTITLLFEVEELKHASPAIVSRCGMIYMESHTLGWDVLVLSYCKGLPAVFTPKRIKTIEEYMISVLKPSVAFATKYFKFPIDVKPMHMVDSFLNMFETFMGECRLPTYKLTAELDSALPNVLVFCLIWSFGGCVEQIYREKFHEYVLDLLGSKDVKMKYKLDVDGDHVPPKFIVKFKEGTNVFELGYDRKKNAWKSWTQDSDCSLASYPRETAFHEIMVPTVDSTRNAFFVRQLLRAGKHLLFVGPTGTGKTACTMAELRRSFNTVQYTYTTLCMSARTSAAQTQHIIESKLEKRGRKVQYGPLQGKKAVVFVDDLNMPAKDQFESQPPLELLRQWMDYGGWYDIDGADKRFKNVEDIAFLAAMAPPSSGRQTISTRYLRHYSVMHLESADPAMLKSMFRSIAEWKMGGPTGGFAVEVSKLAPVLAEASVELCLQLQREEELRPIPSKSHYTFNLRDVSKVFQGVCRATPLAVKKDEDMMRLWANECMRVFHDRLVSQQDREVFMKILKNRMKQHFGKDWENVVTAEPLIFGSFVPCIYPDGDRTKDPITGVYCELADRKLLRSTLDSYITKYKTERHKDKLEIVLFMTAIEQIAQILRIITLPQGHALLVGVGGSGRKSLTALAAFIGKFDLFKVEATRKYKLPQWRTDLRRLMAATGVEQIPTLFFLSDAQLSNDAFLEDVNHILNSGEVPSLYSKLERTEGKEDLMTKLRENLQNHNKKVFGSDEEVLETLREHSRNNLHIVFSMSPSSEHFRTRLRMFPSILNCTTTSWFLSWPEEALRSVASQYLTGEELGEKEREGIVSICVDMQERVRALAERYKKEMQFYYYVTPTSYLELLKTFKKLLASKRKELSSSIKSYGTGLEELKKTEAFVAQMWAKLREMEPEQKKRTETAIHIAESLKKKQAEVQEETKAVQREEEKANETKKVADALQAECQANYDKALPELRDAEKAITKIDQAAISTMQSLTSPSEALKPVAKALCILLDIKPKQVPKSEPDYWLPKKIFTHRNLKKLTELDKENIPVAKITELKKITESVDFSSDKIIIANAEAEAIARWIRAMVKFDQIVREIAPKKAQLKEESEKAQAAQTALANTSSQLNEKKALLANLKQQSEQADAQKKKLTQEIEVTKKKIERARELLDQLKTENKRWNEQWTHLQERYKNVLGDMLISSGIVAYLGAFPANYRESCTDSWKDLLAKFSIPRSNPFSLFNALGDPLQKLVWQKQRLPTDSISTDNAIIMEHSSRWPLIIDPQRQAANWIKSFPATQLKDRVEVIKRSQKADYMMKRIASALAAGSVILFEDLGESIDSRLEPLIRKEVAMEGNRRVVRLGDENVTYNYSFRLILATRLSNPHYSPEICAEVTMINFTATEEGLTDQMLNIIVKKEDPTTDKNREDSIQKSVDIKRRLKANEEEILKIVTSHKEEILESDQLLDTLKSTKLEFQKSTSQVEEQKKASERIEHDRLKFQSVAKRVASLYFCVAELAKINPMYQYSLEWYQDLYRRALEINSDVDQEQKLDLYKKNFSHLLFTSICKSIFESDKLLFTLNLLLNIFVSEGKNTPAEVRFLASGCVPTISAVCPTSPGTWMADKTWRALWELSQTFPAFKDFSTSLAANLAVWGKVVVSATDVVAPKTWPDGWGAPEKLNPLQRLMLINVLRPDKLIEAVTLMIGECLGKEFLEYPAPNLEEAYLAATHKVPIVLILAPGADPLAEVKAFAEKRNLVNSLIPLSLGKGQGKKADLAIDHSLKAKEGGWVIMQNCHFATSYLTHLEKKLDEIPDEPKMPFRLWITSMPTAKFPATLLQHSLKLTLEQPKGLVRNMLESYARLDAGKFADSNPKPQIWRRLLFSLCMFHATVQERGKFGALGWNRVYDFSHADLMASIESLRGFLRDYSEVPWDAIRYMVAEANYGGRMSDPMDARCIQAILSDMFNPEALKDNYRFCKRKEYGLPADLKTKESYINYIKAMPLSDDPDFFGMNETASTTCSLNDAGRLLGTLLSLLPNTVARVADAPEHEVAIKAKQLCNELPNGFDLEECAKKFPYDPKQSLNTVLLQELSKYNELLNVVRKSLNDLQSATKGYLIMTRELEQLADSLAKNAVPAPWEAHAYPSLKPLAGWLKDLAERVRFFQTWVDKGLPDSFWLPALFSPQAFLTGVLQNHARRNAMAVDSLGFECTVLPEQADTSHPTDEGCYIHGLFMEGGAKWNQEKHCLDEAEAKVLYSSVPHIWLKPVERHVPVSDSGRHVFSQAM